MDSCYILYAKIQGGDARVKKGIYPLQGGTMNDVGEANYYTTAQVIIYEVAVAMYGKDVVKCSDIPNFVPTQELLNAVQNALKRCGDAQKDSTVLALARRVAAAYFGAPGGGGGAAAGGGGDIAPAPAFSIQKEVTSQGPYYPGSTVSYLVTVENTGNVDLTGVTFSDSLVNIGNLQKSGDTDNDDILDTGETWIYTYSYTIPQNTQPGTLENTATVDTNETDPQNDSASITVIQNCCVYYFHEHEANWKSGKSGGQNKWDIHVQGLIKNDVCSKKLEIKVEIYDSSGILQKQVDLGLYTPNPAGQISFQGDIDMNQSGPPSGWKYKFTAIDTSTQNQCQEISVTGSVVSRRR